MEEEIQRRSRARSQCPPCHAKRQMIPPLRRTGVRKSRGHSQRLAAATRAHVEHPPDPPMSPFQLIYRSHHGVATQVEIESKC